MIAVVIPTRGLIFTEVEEAVSQNLSGWDYRVYRSFNLPIPDAQNTLVDRALKDNPSHILFIEEDTVMPKGSFEKLIKAPTDIAAVDYSVAGYGCIARDRKTREILWCGLGCTLVRRNVFVNLERPYFRTDKALRLNDWETKKDDWTDIPSEKAYGGHDIWFFTNARKKGFRIFQVPGEAKHLMLNKLGTKGINGGIHDITEREKIFKENLI